MYHKSNFLNFSLRLVIQTTNSKVGFKIFHAESRENELNHSKKIIHLDADTHIDLFHNPTLSI